MAFQSRFVPWQRAALVICLTLGSLHQVRADQNACDEELPKDLCHQGIAPQDATGILNFCGIAAPISADSHTSIAVATLLKEGRAEEARGDLDGALANYNRAQKLAPKFYGIYLFRGLQYLTRHDEDHALADFSAAIALQPAISALYQGRGLL